MMANPIPPVPDLQRSFLEDQEDVKIVQPKPSPRPSPPLEVRGKKIEVETEEEMLDRFALEEFKQFKYDVKPEPAEPEKLVATLAEPSPDILKDLVLTDRMLVVRRLGVKQTLTLRGKKNKFFVRSASRELVYTIEEDNNWWVGYLCYGLRPMTLRVLNAANEEVIRIIRPYSFTLRVLPCQLQRMQVFSPPGHLIGSVLQEWTPMRPEYVVKNAMGHVVFEVRGPRFTVSCFNDVQFQVKRPNGPVVAATHKRWEGLMHALFFAAVQDRFGISFFDKDMKAEEKALILATALLLDYMYYDI